jgi:hypothetical protein
VSPPSTYITGSNLKINQSEHNSLTVGGHVAWAAELNLNTQAIRALNPLSNTWCATGSFLGNGTLLSSGGNPVVITGISVSRYPSLSSKFTQLMHSSLLLSRSKRSSSSASLHPVHYWDMRYLRGSGPFAFD